MNWENEFINNIFKLKTTFKNTFSQIVLNNIDLLETKRQYIPHTLFKFYKPTSQNIIDIKKQRLWMADPGKYNDPFDCKIGYNIGEYAKYVLIKYIKRIGCIDGTNSHNGFTSDEFDKLLLSTTSDRRCYSRAMEEYHVVLRTLLYNKSKAFADKINDVIMKANDEVNNIIEKLRGINIRVASFSALDNNKDVNNTLTQVWSIYDEDKGVEIDNLIQMWSHYADNHEGFCIEYDMSNIIDHPFAFILEGYEFHKDPVKYTDERIGAVILGGLFPVTYTASRVNIPKTKLHKIKFDERNKLQHDIDVDALLYKTYIVKSAKWSYEKEWRIILDGDVCNYYDNRIPFPYIKRVFLGCRMSQECMDTMIEIAEELGAEVVIMAMDNKKFILEERGTSLYKWYKKWAKETKKPF